MKSQDRIKDSTKIPGGRKINRDFHFFDLFFIKIAKRLPVAVNFCFIVFKSGSKHERKSSSYFSIQGIIFIIWAKIKMIYT